jgi:DNA-binding NtrC family response regulator
LNNKIPTAFSRVLVVDDDPASQRLLEVRVRAIGCQVSIASDGQEGLAAMQQQAPAVILLDLEMPRMDGMELLRKLRRDGVDIPIIVITAHGSIERAVEAMKEGAYDFLPKPFDPNHLEIVVRKALERERLKREVEVLSEETDKRYRLIIGSSERMKESVATAKKAAASNATVLLLGESGTGKEIFARAIHNWSERKNQPFVAINCVGLSKELLESELFGHEKGAFTGADQPKKGKMELANGGTVFLDEIGDVSAELQTKLLRFLQEREFDRVGGLRPVHVDVRIIAATNRDLDLWVKEGRFREDLYHRLNVIPITLPPLKERREDIPALAGYFLRRYSVESKKKLLELTEEAVEKLCAYHWPGNVRELANVIERAVVLSNGAVVTIKDLPNRVVASAERMDLKNVSYRTAMNSARRNLIMGALMQFHGNRAAAARSLGLHEKYFLRLLKSFGIHE